MKIIKALHINASALLLTATLGVNAAAQTTTAPAAAAAQNTSAGAAKSDITATYALGEVMSVDATGKQIMLHTTVGDISVLLGDATKYKRVAPGAKTISDAEAITLADVGVGDRIIAQGKVAADRKSIPARQLIVMSKAAIAQKHERDREQWRRRGISGRVTAINPSANEITISARSREGERAVVIAANDKASFRRYAPDSVKFDDAKQSSLAEIKVGDQLRALGERSADGARFIPEEVVTGSFRMVGGTITAINSAANEIKVTTIQTNQLITVVVNKDSVLRRIPPELAMMVAMRRQGGGSRGGGGARGEFGSGGGGGNAGGTAAQPSGNASGGGQANPVGAAGGREARPGGGEFPGGNRPRMGGGGGAGGGDLQDVVERLPGITLADLKPGDMILVSSTTGTNPSRVTAITLATGIDALLRTPAGAAPGRSAARPQGGNIGGADDIFGGGIGLP